MAIPTAPLLSFGASGSVAQTIVYSKWKGRPYVRRYVIPSNPKTVAQTLTRDVFAASNSYWKGAPSLFISAWDLFATGQVLTGRNAFTGRYVSILRPQANSLLFPFSPGAKGGLAALSMVITPGSTQLSVDVTVPATPTGWTLTSAIVATLKDDDPAAPAEFTITAGEDVTDPFTVLLTGLTASVLYVVGAWLKWAKPDGSVAYGPSINDSGTPTA